MFKVGNRVRVLPNYSYGKLKAGEIYTITRIENSNRGYDEIFLKDVPNFYGSVGYHPCRFELVEEGFNISTATDQELADEIRRIWTEYVPLYNALNEKGYMLAGYGCGVGTEAKFRVYKNVPAQVIEL